MPSYRTHGAPVPTAPSRRPGSPRRHPVLVALGALVVAGGVVRAFWTLASTSWAEVGAPGPGSPADVLLAGLAALGGLLTAWLGAGVAVSALADLHGAAGAVAGAAADRLAPAAVRRAAALLLGTALTVTLAPGPALGGERAAPAPTLLGGAPPPVPPARPTDSAAFPAALDPQFQVTSPQPPQEPATPAAPGRPAYVPSPPPPPTGTRDLGPLGGCPKPGTSVEEHVVVRRGDTLWDIAARHLPSGATSAEIALEWPRWYAANRTVVGADPDLIQPGTRLVPPDGLAP